MKKWWYALFALLIVSFIFDKQIVDFFVNNRIDAINTFVVWFTSGYTILIVGFIITSLYLWNERKKKWIIPLWLSGLISFWLVQVIKLLIARERPDVLFLVDMNDYSFPSGHAAVVFSAIPILDAEFPKLKWFWLVFAILIIISRLYVGVHYPSDIIAGCIIGLTIGYMFYRGSKFKPDS